MASASSVASVSGSTSLLALAASKSLEVDRVGRVGDTKGVETSTQERNIIKCGFTRHGAESDPLMYSRVSVCQTVGGGRPLPHEPTSPVL